MGISQKRMLPSKTTATNKLLHQRRGASSGSTTSMTSSFGTTMMNLRQILACVMVVYMVILWYIYVTSSSSFVSPTITTITMTTPLSTKSTTLRRRSSNSHNLIPEECTFRDYPDRRYYHVQKDTATIDFLSSSDYIYGSVPVVLQSSGKNPTKLCVNQSEWISAETTTTTTTTQTQQRRRQRRRPFADGTNPSLLNFQRLGEKDMPSTTLRTYKYFQSLGTTFLGTICMTDSQCSWKDTPSDVEKYHLSLETKPATVRTLLVALNDQGDILHQISLALEIDGPWGRHIRTAQYEEPTTSQSNNNTVYKRTWKGFDDARLFRHKGELWITYRQGKDFGYDKQVLNRIHFDVKETATTATAEDDDEDDKESITTQQQEDLNKEAPKSPPTYTAYVKASESSTLCCGRNMAMMENTLNNNTTTNGLESLSWVDPVTVMDVPLPSSPEEEGRQRQLRETTSHPKKSHFHGTNGYLIWLPSTQEYLGIGHFHRPSGRDTSDYARHGHHYTHAFFTISSSSSSSGSPPKYQLSRLSPEFVFATLSPQFTSSNSNSNSKQPQPDVTDIIQFASGMELVDPSQDDETGTLLIAYGINDCEAASIHLPMKDVQQMLLKVPPGKQVVDFMKPL